MPPLGIVNGHPSLLPRYRGPFPLAWAVRNGEREIGLTYHLMDAEFDTGNLLAQAAIPLDDDDTRGDALRAIRPDRRPSSCRSPSTASPAATAATARRAGSTRASSRTSTGRSIRRTRLPPCTARCGPGASCLRSVSSGPFLGARRPAHQGEEHEPDGARGGRAARVRRRPSLDRRQRAGLMPRPTIWKPRYATRRMRERAWTRADLERERAARAAPAAPSLLARLLRVLR